MAMATIFPRFTTCNLLTIGLQPFFRKSFTGEQNLVFHTAAANQIIDGFHC